MADSNDRGLAFEKRVESVLDDLRNKHPTLVEVRRQPKLDLHSDETLRPDFELRYDSGHQKDARLIECQSRERSSSQIVHKIRHIKSLSPRNRFIFVYEDPDYLSDATTNSLKKDGVAFYSFAEFSLFVDRLDLKLQGVKIASALAEYGQATGLAFRFEELLADALKGDPIAVRRAEELLKRMRDTYGKSPLRGFDDMGPFRSYTE